MAGNGQRGVSTGVLQLFWQVIVAVVTAAVTAMAMMYGIRDGVRAECLAHVEEAKREIIAQRSDDLKHYVSLEQFLDFRRQERERSDAQYYGLLEAMSKIQARLDGGRR